MTDIFIISPILIHMITAVLCMALWKKVTAIRLMSFAGSSLGLWYSIGLFRKTWDSGILTMQAGNWPAPFGITFVSDTFSSLMVLLTAIAAWTIGLYSLVAIRKSRVRFGYYSIFHFLIMGLSGAFLTGDIFNLYVWFEIVIISSFVLMTLGGQREQMEGAIKYVAMNMLASVFFLTAIGILYGITGSLNMADLSIKVAAIENRSLVNISALLFFIGFGIKSAVFPLYYWLPSSYHTPPSATAAIFGALLTKVGVYAMFRTVSLIFVPDDFMKSLLVFTAVMTMITGALGALNQKGMRRIYSYLLVCHIGYFMAGLGMFTQLALTGALFYIVHDIIVKSNLFLVNGIIYRVRGTTDITLLGGFQKQYPNLSLVFALVFLSLVGIPPLSGFWPKINLISEAMLANSYILTGALLLASFVTLMVIMKIWKEVFWKTPAEALNPEANTFRTLSKAKKLILVGPVVLLLMISLYIGLFAENIYLVAERIAGEMLNTEYYIKAVLQQ